MSITRLICEGCGFPQVYCTCGPAPKPEPLACYECLLVYGGPGWADFVVPDDVWAQISPTGDEGGILCATCMFRRMETLGIECDGRFTSGPCAQHDWKKPPAERERWRREIRKLADEADTRPIRVVTSEELRKLIEVQK